MDMTSLTDRAQQMIDALTSAIMGATEAAAEKLHLATEVARIQVRMEAVSAVLDLIGTQKAALAEKAEGAKGALAALYAKQFEALTVQETAILERIGVPTDAARSAVESADPPKYQREGSRFKRLSAANGHAG